MTSQPARAFWVTAPREGKILDETLPSPAPDDAVVRTRYSGISRGTESLVFAGACAGERTAAHARAVSGGGVPAPVKYGYCNVGEVESGSTASSSAVACSRSFRTRRVSSCRRRRFTRCPPTYLPDRAVLAANMETAVNGVWDAGIQPGDRVAVIGAGAVGCLVAWLAGRIPGCDVELVDIKPSREAVATPSACGSPLRRMRPRDRDVVIHASGSPAGLALALSDRCVRGDDRRDELVRLAAGAAAARRGLSREAAVDPIVAGRACRDIQRARWDYQRRMALALSLLREPALDVADHRRERLR